jgi:hypothetical protein
VAGRVQHEHAVGVADVPVHLPGGVHAAALEPVGVEIDGDVHGPRESAPDALAVVVHGGDPGARMPAVEGVAEGLEAEPARVRAREKRAADVVPGAAPAAVVGQRVARRRWEERSATGGGVKDEEAGEDPVG